MIDGTPWPLIHLHPFMECESFRIVVTTVVSLKHPSGMVKIQKAISGDKGNWFMVLRSL